LWSAVSSLNPPRHGLAHASSPSLYRLIEHPIPKGLAESARIVIRARIRPRLNSERSDGNQTRHESEEGGKARHQANSAKEGTSKAAVRGAAKKKAETITLKLVFEQLAQQRDMPKKHGHEMMEGMIDLVTAHLKKGDRVRMSGLGVLQVKDRPARLGRNPATGESIQIAASKKVAFRPAKELKEAV
jgi:DNA-binding protein HU-beta